MYPVMVNGLRTFYPCGLNKGFGSEYRDRSRFRLERPGEGQSTYDNKDGDNNSNTK